MILFAAVRPIKVLPRIRIAPGYLLVDQNGSRVSSEDMRGQITLYSFISTQCELPCAGTEGMMADVAAQLAPQSDIPVELVTIAVDGPGDGPANGPANAPDALRAYALHKGIEPSRRLLGGEAQQVKLVVGGGFNTFYESDSNGQLQIDPALMLVDGLGILRAEYRDRSLSTKNILRDIDLLTQEARNSTGLTRYAYEAAHLFLCYP